MWREIWRKELGRGKGEKLVEVAVVKAITRAEAAIEGRNDQASAVGTIASCQWISLNGWVFFEGRMQIQDN